jgi:hypothetical protein
MSFNLRGPVAALALGGLATLLGACTSQGSGAPVTTRPNSTTSSVSQPATTLGPVVPAGTPPIASVLLEEIRSAIDNSSGVHVAGSSATKSTKVVDNFDDDLGQQTGIEQLSSASARLEIRVTTKRAYLSGNSGGLVQFFGAPQTIAQGGASKWYYVASTSSEYAQFKLGATLKSIDNAYLPARQSVTVSTASLDGTKTFALKWKQTPDKAGLNVTLYVRASGPPLLIREVGQSSAVSQVVNFSNWGEKIVVPTPSPVLALSKIFG